MSSVAPPAANSASVQSSANSTAAQQASLNRLMAKYKAEISKDPDAHDLGSLGRQITALAKTLGQNVTLPHASASAVATDNASSTSNQVNVKA